VRNTFTKEARIRGELRGGFSVFIKESPCP